MVGASLVLLEVGSLPVHGIAYILGASFIPQMQANIAAAQATATLVGKITLFPWVSAGIFTAMSVVMTSALICLIYHGETSVLDYLRRKIASGDVAMVERLAFLVPVLACLPGPSLKKLAQQHPEVLKLILQAGEGQEDLGVFYQHHLAPDEETLRILLTAQPVDRAFVLDLIGRTPFDANSDVGACVAACIVSWDLTHAQRAAFVAQLREAKYAKGSPVFASQFLWVNPQVFAEAGYGEILFDRALQKDKIPTARYLFNRVGIKPSKHLLEMALAHPQGEALASALFQRGIQIAFPFHTIASAAVARRLHQAGGAITSCDSAGNSPLHAAAAQGFEGPFDYYLDHGLDLMQKNHAGETPFDLACKHGRSRMITKIMQAKGARTGPYNHWVWARAAEQGDLEMVQGLFEHTDQDLFAIGWDGQNALDGAASNGHCAVALWIAEKMREYSIGSLGVISQRYRRVVKKAAQMAHFEGHHMICQKLQELGAFFDCDSVTAMPASASDANPRALNKRRRMSYHPPYGDSQFTNRYK